jgi:hypothetical protein
MRLSIVFARRQALIAAGLIAAALPSAAAAREKNHILAYVAMLDPNGSLQTRTYAGAFVNLYNENNVGLHADVVHVEREEDATFFSVGVSVPVSRHVRPRLMLGSSTNNQNILPDVYAGLSVEIRPGEQSGWIVTPGIAWRHYRSGLSETIGTLGVTRYFNVPWDRNGYYAVQASVAASVSDRDSVRASLNAGLQTVRRSGVIIGFNAEGGSLVSDAVHGADYQGRYFALRPNLAVPIGGHLQLITRGEYVDTELYDAVGGLAGIKVEF